MLVVLDSRLLNIGVDIFPGGCGLLSYQYNIILFKLLCLLLVFHIMLHKKAVLAKSDLNRDR